MSITKNDDMQNDMHNDEHEETEVSNNVSDEVLKVRYSPNCLIFVL
jgi:hypothetical protein